MRRFIAIDGMGGAGKTYLANLLKEKLDAKVFHLDDYGNDYEPFIGIPLLVEELRKTEDELIIYEGVGVFDSCFDEFDSFKILVEVGREVNIKRAAQRDVPTKDRSKEEWDRIWSIWIVAQDKYFTEDIYKKADMIVGESIDIESIVSEILKK